MRFISPMFLSQTAAKQRGSMLIISLFILLVLGVLGTGLVNMLQSEDRAAAFEVFAVRATEAARTGADAMLAQIFPPGGTAQRCSTIGSPQVVDLSSVAGLDGCNVSTICQDTADTPINGEIYYQITATANCGGGSGTAAFNVERRIVAEAKAI